jgi:hypothetical protein
VIIVEVIIWLMLSFGYVIIIRLWWGKCNGSFEIYLN